MTTCDHLHAPKKKKKYVPQIEIATIFQDFSQEPFTKSTTGGLKQH